MSAVEHWYGPTWTSAFSAPCPADDVAEVALFGRVPFAALLRVLERAVGEIEGVDADVLRLADEVICVCLLTLLPSSPAEDVLVSAFLLELCDDETGVSEEGTDEVVLFSAFVETGVPEISAGHKLHVIRETSQ